MSPSFGRDQPHWALRALKPKRFTRSVVFLEVSPIFSTHNVSDGFGEKSGRNR